MKATKKPSASATGTTRKKKVKTKPRKTPRTRKPEDMSLEEWQIALRKEFGREQNFKLKNIGDEPVFSDFLVTNPDRGSTYKVAIRGNGLGESYCSCPDFSVNTLGTCKHIEFAIARLERRRGGKKAFREGYHPPHSAVFLRYGAKRDVCFRVGTECPPQLIAFAGDFFDEDGVLKPGAYGHFHTFLKKAPCDGHDLRCYEDTLEYVAQVRDEAKRRKRILKAFPKGAMSPAFKNLLKASLYPYQRKGALFAASAGRSLIADDMGLGKTIQAIAAVEILAKTVGVERVLVIAPTAVKHQWKQEIERFSKRGVEVVEGLLAKRGVAYRTDSFYKVTNYEVIHTDTDFIEEWAPDVIILDEAQRIKNWQTRRARSVKQLSSDYAIVLTGTPLENRLEELHSIVEFVDRFHLGPLFRFLGEHQHTDENGRVVGYRNLSHIARTLDTILMRRTKDQVLKELPERIDEHFFVPMTEEQWEHHEGNKKTVGEIVQKWRRFGFLSERDQRRLMIAMQNMRMSCNSTYLLDKETDCGEKADEFMRVVEDLLEEPDTKVVVFSQWLRTHELIIRRLEAHGKWGHAFYHGGRRSQERKKLIQRFKEDPECRILLATDAGGVGLNLQNASVIVNMDQPWNPAVLEQRIGRVHRLGQRRCVRVFNFVAQGTIEHGMLSVIKFKKSVFAGVLDGGENEVFLGGTRLTKFMETVEKATEATPVAMPLAEEAPEPSPQAPPAAAQETIAKADELVADQATLAEEKAAKPAPSGEQEAWTELISTGLSFLDKLGKAMVSTTGASQKGTAAPPLAALMARDEKTGEEYLKVPVPSADVLSSFAQALGGLAETLRSQEKR